MKKFIYIIASILCTYNSKAQQDSIPLGVVTYIQQSNLPGDEQNNGYATLLFNPTNSLYIQNSAPRSDSSFLVADTQVSVSGDKQGFPIYKAHQKRRLISRISCRDATDHCIVRDTFGNIAWSLQPEHKKFGQFDCRRATGKFRGRMYEAWYAPDIPVPSGPFKLGGLPGLILEAQTLDGKVKFLFKSLMLSASSKITGTIRPPAGNALKVDQETYERETDAFTESLIREYKAKGVEVSITRQETIEIWNER